MKTNKKSITVVSSDDVALGGDSKSTLVIEKNVITPRVVVVDDGQLDKNSLYKLNKKLEGDRVSVGQAQTKRGANHQGTK